MFLTASFYNSTDGSAPRYRYEALGVISISVILSSLGKTKSEICPYFISIMRWSVAAMRNSKVRDTTLLSKARLIVQNSFQTSYLLNVGMLRRMEIVILMSESQK
jgi:hypothetical protein